MSMTDQILKRAEELHSAKMTALAPLAELMSVRAELRRKLAETDTAYGRAYADAEAAGWSAEELGGIGAETPAKRPKGRPRKARQRRVTPSDLTSPAAATDKLAPLPEQSAPSETESSPV